MGFVKTFLSVPGLLALFTLSASSYAGEKLYISNSTDGPAIKGYDAVAYFTLGKPKKGREEFIATWNNATWHFSTVENAELFKKNPEQYAPQYGAYCAWAVGHNYTYPADPLAWKIFEGKLYLNANKQVQEQWLKEIPLLIEKADKNWPDVLKK